MPVTGAPLTTTTPLLRGAASGPLERVVEVALLCCGLLSIATTAGVLLVLSGETIAFLREVGLAALLFDTEWTPLFAQKRFGIWPLVTGTMLTSAIAVSVALPFGLLSAIFLSEIAPRSVRHILKGGIEILAGVPTIVYGYFALIVVTPALQAVVPGLAGFNALSAGLVMGLMILPLISSLSEDALHAVPQSLREGALALGASRVSMVVRVVVPAARSGITAATLLAVGRAVGETMIVAIAAGQQPRLTFDPRVPVETMTAYIVQVSMGDVPAASLEYRTLFVVGAVLFLLTFSFNALARRVMRGSAQS